jgi:hypothetical protein
MLTGDWIWERFPTGTDKKRSSAPVDHYDMGDWPHFLRQPAWLERERVLEQEREHAALEYDALRKHLVAARARGGKSAKKLKRDDVFFEVGLTLRQKNPNKPAEWIAPRAHRQVNDRLRAEYRKLKEAAQHSCPPTVVKPLKLPRESTIYSYLRKNWARIAPPK